jgi:hypothetical protein
MRLRLGLEQLPTHPLSERPNEVPELLELSAPGEVRQQCVATEEADHVTCRLDEENRDQSRGS